MTAQLPAKGRTPELLEALATAELSIVGRLVEASNATLLCTLSYRGESIRCVYKPTLGERPLWDFHDGTLGRREVATAVIAAQLELELVPPTVWREGGPAGAGMCQLWIEGATGGTDVEVVTPDQIPAEWLVSVHGIDAQHREVVVVHADTQDLRRLALFDILVNNADRKGGHILRDTNAQVFAVDHGVTFHVEDKLRTVLWGWADSALSPDELSLLAQLAHELGGEFGQSLGAWLRPEEVAAVAERVDRLLAAGKFPTPSGDWPAVPWPVF